MLLWASSSRLEILQTSGHGCAQKKAVPFCGSPCNESPTILGPYWVPLLCFKISCLCSFAGPGIVPAASAARTAQGAYLPLETLKRNKALTCESEVAVWNPQSFLPAVRELTQLLLLQAAVPTPTQPYLDLHTASTCVRACHA